MSKLLSLNTPALLPIDVHDYYFGKYLISKCGHLRQSVGYLPGEMCWVLTGNELHLWKCQSPSRTSVLESCWPTLPGQWHLATTLSTSSHMTLGQQLQIQTLQQTYSIDTGAAMNAIISGKSPQDAISELIKALDAHGRFCVCDECKLKPLDVLDMKAQRKKDGVCVECGDKGESRNMVWFCRNGHGKIF